MNDNEPTTAQHVAFLKSEAEKVLAEADEAEGELQRNPTDRRLRRRIEALRKLAADAFEKVEELQASVS